MAIAIYIATKQVHCLQSPTKSIREIRPPPPLPPFLQFVLRQILYWNNVEWDGCKDKERPVRQSPQSVINSRTCVDILKSMIVFTFLIKRQNNSNTKRNHTYTSPFSEIRVHNWSDYGALDIYQPVWVEDRTWLPLSSLLGKGLGTSLGSVPA